MDVNNTQNSSNGWDKDIDVEQWYFMGSPVPVMTIMVSYWLFVLKLGPMYMENKKPYVLTRLLGIYNLLQVLFSFSIVYQGVNFIWDNGIIQTDCVMDKYHLKKAVAIGTYCFFVAKLTELLDTVFFILRKKYNQASFLHIYHHSFTVCGTWVILKYEENYSALIFLGTLNSFVHIVMYTYYGLSAYPKLAKYLWWKKYITKLQLVQFVTILVHLLTEYKMAKCKPSYILMSVVCFNLVLFVYLFSDFYFKTYNKQQAVNNINNNVSKKVKAH